VKKEGMDGCLRHKPQGVHESCAPEHPTVPGRTSSVFLRSLSKKKDYSSYQVCSIISQEQIFLLWQFHPDSNADINQNTVAAVDDL